MCMNVSNDMLTSIDDVNTEIIINMTDQYVKYEDVCIKPNIIFDHYYNSLKQKWETIINDYINKPEKCSNNIQNILTTYDAISKLGSAQIPDYKTIENIVYEKLFDISLKTITDDSSSNNFVMNEDIIITMKKLANVFGTNCQCQMIDIVSFIINKYKTKYTKKLVGKTRNESIAILIQDYEYIKDTIQKYGQTTNNTISDQQSQNTDPKTNPTSLITQSTALLNFSIEKELNKLIPDEMGSSIKIFFIKVITRYFNNLHPIIWAQIFNDMMSNIFNDLPLTPEEIFSFVSKYLLLNSGPFILKILQTIRPNLSDKVATKYNLTKLIYPLIKSHQIDIILKRAVVDHDMFKIIYNKSASVGHVCIGYDVRNPDVKIVIKIVKPLAFAQSCWEYYILHDMFPRNSCEYKYITNTLKSNGLEMNVANEIKNIAKSNRHYTTNYNTEFGININAKLTTVAHIPGIIKEGTWFALAMTLAPGIPLSDIIENKLIENDTKYRANLYRCLDLLVTKFFYVLISQGFYHGDLHSGNIFYSFVKKQITIIDFGAMGNIDLYSNDETIATLILIIIMSIHYDYDSILDVLTDILNSRCTEDTSTFINKNTEAYQVFKKELLVHKLKNMLNFEKEKKNSMRYIANIMSNNRLNDENSIATLITFKDIADDNNDKKPSIYDSLEKIHEAKDTVIENKDILPTFTETLGKSESISFDGILHKIIKFFALSNINVAIKLSEINELQKAYILLLGVLSKTGYNSYRMSEAIKTGILNWGHLPRLLNINTTYKVVSKYWKASTQYNYLFKLIENERRQILVQRIAQSMPSNTMT